MKKLFVLLVLLSGLTWAQYSPDTYCADAGSTDDYACNLVPPPVAYVTGQTYYFKANTANTGAATVNFNSIGAKTIVKVAGGVPTTLADNDIRIGQIVELSYDGTNMQMQSTLGNAAGGGGGGGTAGSPLAVQTTSVTVTSNAESTLIGSVAGSLTIPANWFTAAGTVMEVCASGVVTTAAAAQGTLQFKLKMGSTVVAQTSAFTPTASLSNDAYDFCIRLTARTVGAMGTIMASNIFPLTAPGLATPDLTNFTNPTPGTAVTVDTTSTQAINLTSTFSANATNSITQTNFYMVGPGSAVSSVFGLTGAVMSTTAADTVVMNATGGSAAPTAVAMPTCTTGADLYNTSTHAWSCVSGGGIPWQQTITDPTGVGFSWRNQGSATVTSHTGSIYLAAPAHSGVNIIGREISAPGSTPWSITVGLQPIALGVGNLSVGMYVSDGTKLVVTGLGDGGGSSLFVAKYTSVTAFSANYSAPNWPIPPSPVFIKVVDDGTNLVWSVSMNGIDFLQIDTHTITNFLASASFIGFYVDSETASWPVGLSLVSWTQGTN